MSFWQELGNRTAENDPQPEPQIARYLSLGLVEHVQTIEIKRIDGKIRKHDSLDQRRHEQTNNRAGTNQLRKYMWNQPSQQTNHLVVALAWAGEVEVTKTRIDAY